MTTDNPINICDYPNYRVYECGIVESKARGSWKPLKQCDDRYGYPKVTLCKNGSKTTRHVHDIVARAFVDGYKPGLEVNHRNGDKHNNHSTNLEWVSGADNLRHAYSNGLNKGPCKKVRVVETGVVYASEKECAESIGGTKSGVNGCLKGRRHTYKRLHYEYVD